MSSIVIFLSVKMSALKNLTNSDVFAIEGLDCLHLEFQTSLWFAILNHNKFDDWCQALYLIWHLEPPQNTYFYKIEIIFPFNQFQTM